MTPPHANQPRSIYSIVGYLLFLVFTLSSLQGCIAYRAIKIEATAIREQLGVSALTNKKELREETNQQLKLYNLAELNKEDPKAVIEQMEDYLTKDYDPDMIVAASELSLAHARTLEEKNPKESCAYYMLSIDLARTFLLRSLGTTAYSPVTRKPRFAADLYNESVSRIVVLWQEQGIPFTESLEVSTGTRDYSIDITNSGENLLDPSYFDELDPTYGMQVEGLRNHYRLYGLGAPFIGIRGNRPDTGEHSVFMTRLDVVQPLTAIVTLAPRDFKSGDPDLHSKPLRGSLRFYDPSQIEEIKLQNLDMPLEADFSTSLAVLLERQKTTNLWFIDAFLRAISSDKYSEQIGLIALEPYNPKKIPVVMVHGLFSDPRTYIDMFNDLRSRREIRENYQFFFFYYPTGLPIYFTSYHLREKLKELQATFDPDGTSPVFNDMVLVGHSMGGLLSRLMIEKNGDTLWNEMFYKQPEELDLDEDDRKIIVGALKYDPLPFIKRVIFVATPHRGSDIALNTIGRIGSWLISLPVKIVSLTASLLEKNIDAIKLEGISLNAAPATSIDQLSPKNPLTSLMLSLPLADNVPVHSIIGIQESTQGPGSTDGVVKYESSHIEGAESEKLVPAPHSCLEHPFTIGEIKRILLEHLSKHQMRLGVLP